MELPRLKIGMDTETLLPVYIQDRHTHILCLGKSGKGKSTSVLGWYEADHFYKNAKILIDPSGFLSRDAYSISGGKYCSIQNPISMNPMRAVGYTESQIVDLLGECLNQMVTAETSNQVITAKMWDIFSEAVRYCLKNNRRSLLNVRDYIANMKGSTETRDGLLARMNFLLNDETMVKIICGNNSVDWGELIKNKETFIMDCSGMSHLKMVFCGNLVSQGLKAYFRYSKPKEYFPCSVYIDEFQNFVNENYYDIISESRKYKLALCLATQSFATFSGTMVKMMLTVGNIVAYCLASKDARLIASEMDMTPQALQFLESYHVGYMTTKGTGIAKAPHPPIFKERKLPTAVDPQRNSKKPSWFTLDPSASYPQPESQ